MNSKAPELRVAYWIDPEGKARSPLKLAELGDGYKLIYCFQAWCPGCHERGFPTLVNLVDNLAAYDIGFAVVQTVFEGAEENTQDKLREMQLRYGLKLPFGHDEGEPHPSTMIDYRTGGTPWFILIDPGGTVVFSDFHLNADALIEALKGE